MVLDTFSYLERAVDLYYKLGFEVTKKYYDSPIKDVIYLGLDLKNKANQKNSIDFQNVSCKKYEKIQLYR